MNRQTVSRQTKYTKLQNVAIAMHCNLRPPDAAPAVIRFNYDANAKFEVGELIHCSLIPFLLLM